MGAPDTILPLLDGHRFRRRVIAETGSARVDLAAVRASGRPYVATLGPNTRSQIRRACRLYDERGGLRLDAAQDVDEALAYFAAAGPLHQARWEARGKPGAFASPHYVDFHQRLIRAAWSSGAVDLLRVSAGDEPIGYLYNFVHRGTVYFYLSALRYEADNRLKPGLVTHALAIQHYVDRGLATYDFMAGASRYKASLGQPGPAILHLRLEPPGLKLHLLDLARRCRDQARRMRSPTLAPGAKATAGGGGA